MRAYQLFEYNREATAKNWGEKLLAAADKDKSYRAIHQLQQGRVDQRYLDDILQRLESADPTKNKEYTQWLAKVYSTGTVKIEDILSRGADALTKYAYAKRKNMLKPEHKDIGRLSFANLEDIASQVTVQDQEEKQKQKPQQAIEYYKDADLRIIIPRDEESACYYGQGTKWCTAAKNNNMFNFYNEKGPLYIIIPTRPEYPGEKFQFSFAVHQFMNEKDEKVDLIELLRRFPQLKQVFADEAKEYQILEFLMDSNTLLSLWSQAVKNVKDEVYYEIIRNKDQLMKLMLTDLSRYAKRHIGGGWREAMDDLEFIIEPLFKPASVATLTGYLSHQLKNSDYTSFNDDDSFDDVLNMEIIPNWFQYGAPGLTGDIADILEIDEEGDEMYDIYHEILYTISPEIKKYARNVVSQLFNKYIK